jgi:hypothetical protein
MEFLDKFDCLRYAVLGGERLRGHPLTIIYGLLKAFECVSVHLHWGVITHLLILSWFLTINLTYFQHLLFESSVVGEKEIGWNILLGKPFCTSIFYPCNRVLVFCNNSIRHRNIFWTRFRVSTILGVDSPLKIGRKQLQVSIRIAEAGEVYVLKVRATRSAG